MGRVESSEVAEVPIACTFGPARWCSTDAAGVALSETGRPNVRRSGHLVEVRYEPELGVREELAAVAAAERECCSFVAWEVSQDQDHVVLRVTADPGAPDDVAAIAALFGAD